ncbi:hypothetical protein [Leptolyngbya sp. FACHB-8]|uniref:hypothetical protein n=1 Tax=unclassified Leptolyngbya TaxID=2650499 RepID=UPI001681C978|nr:hypothetical protein [Leptolyngbya sp. FACHB-8]MBD1911283.1 hypothetical protein [Leptolyngbya sp. FACHB-8]
MKVLIIEEGFNDSPNVEAVLQQSYRVLTASTVEEGISVIQREKLEMVFWEPNLAEERAAVVQRALCSAEKVAC